VSPTGPGVGSIRCQGLGKRYRRYPSPRHRLAEWLTGGLYHRHEEHWAIRDVGLDIAAGEAVGIVGQNGAGKSTLLKLLVGTTRPSAGELSVVGRVSALLELGMGFHPDFTGRQNALMALQMIGFGGEEGATLLPAVADFAELGDFLEQPLRTYSSGMQMRLGFAVATAVRPDVLIVDEALSVGDAYFQHKCIRRIREFKESATTMLFVSHDPAAVKTLCDRAVLLDAGRLVHAGSAEAVLDYYNALIARREQEFSIHQAAGESDGRAQTRSGDGAIRIAAVDVQNASGQSVRSFATGETATVLIRLQAAAAVSAYAVGIMLRDRLGNEVFGANTTYLGVASPAVAAGDRVEVRFAVELRLGYGHYALTVAVHGPAGHLESNHDWLDNATVFQVIPGDGYRFAGVACLPATARFDPRPA
jgi:lipopolysaccharide transport system ATP-binding protein